MLICDAKQIQLKYLFINFNSKFHFTNPYHNSKTLNEIPRIFLNAQFLCQFMINWAPVWYTITCHQYGINRIMSKLI